AGGVVSTEPYRKPLVAPHALGLGEALFCWFVVVTCYTATNPAFLACLAAFLGGIARRVRIDGEGADTSNDSWSSQKKAYLSAIMRGFFLYLVVLSGLLLLTTQAITNPSQEQYVRLAGTISVLSFLVGSDTTLFARIMHRVTELAQGREQAGADAKGAANDRTIASAEARSATVPPIATSRREQTPQG